MFVYDVYLKKRLTEIDAIITQLVQRDSFSMYDLLNIYCSMDDIEIQKNFNIESTAFFDATLNVNMDEVGVLIDSLCDMSKVLNTPKVSETKVK